MKLFIGSLIGLVLSVHVGAEPLLEGRVRLSSGQPAVGVQVRLFDLTDLRRSVGKTTDETGFFVLSLQTLSVGRTLPIDFALGQNYPNPFNPSTIIPYQLPTAGHVRLEVFNVLGQRLATLVDAEQSAGMHTAQWDATDAAGRAVGAGVYIYRLSNGGMTESRRMVLVDGQAGIPAVGAAIQGPVRSKVEGAVETDGSVYGMTVSGEGLVAYVDPAFRVGVDEADIVIEEHGSSPRMKLTTGRILGDVNNDGQVDAFDALYVLLYSEDSSISLPNNGDISLGDVNGDGQIDLADAILLATYSVNPSDPSLPPGIGHATPDLVPPVSETSVGQDTAFSHIYWTDWDTDKIQRANLDGSNVETLVAVGQRSWSLQDLALDENGGKVYWTDGLHRVQRANLDGSYIETLIITGDGTGGIALDVAEGKMYWTGGQRPKPPTYATNNIRRANLDGSNIETLIMAREDIFDVALDLVGGKMYWMGFDNGIQRANLDGSNIEILVLTENRISDIILDSTEGKMYWADYKRLPEEGKIQRANLDGSNIETLVTGLDSRPKRLALDVGEGKVYWSKTDVFGNDTRSEIQRVNLDGSNIETLVTTKVSASNNLDISSIFLDLTGGKIYWTVFNWNRSKEGKIQRANLDGSNIETLVTGLTYLSGFPDLGFCALGGFYEPPNTEETRTRNPEEARSELSERGIPYSQRSFVTYAQDGDLDVVRLFIEAGMDVNVQPYSSSVAHIAETKEDDLVAVWFPQPGDEDNNTALMKAAGQGHIEVVRFLVGQGADLDIRNRQEQNALMLAAAGGHLAVATFLIDSGVYASVSPPLLNYNYGNGPQIALEWAVYYGHLDVVRLLLEVIGAFHRPDPNPSLGWAAYRGHLDVARLLLEHGAVVNGQPFGIGFLGPSALMLAAYSGHSEMVRFLLERGADIHARENKIWRVTETPFGPVIDEEIGNSALDMAIDQGHAEVVRLLLQHWMAIYGADGQDVRGRTTLMYAAYAGDLEMARLMLENGAPVNVQTDVGTTALMFAAAYGYIEMVRFLVENGADIHIQNGYGYTALSLAEEGGIKKWLTSSAQWKTLGNRSHTTRWARIT